MRLSAINTALLVTALVVMTVFSMALPAVAATEAEAAAITEEYDRLQRL